MCPVGSTTHSGNQTMQTAEKKTVTRNGLVSTDVASNGRFVPNSLNAGITSFFA